MIAGEIIFIVDPDENEKFVTEVVKDEIMSLGKVKTIENWGLRKLAYPIQKKNEGKYTLVDFETTNWKKLTDKLIKYFTEEPKVLKHIIIRK